MIDIHSHILPNLDDGPKTMEEAVEMARMMSADGVDSVIATPHVAGQKEIEASACIRQNVDELQKALEDNGIAIKVFAGAEVFPSHDTIKAVESGPRLTLGDSGKYLLLDTPLSVLPFGLEEMIFRLQMKGITPILAHPERSLSIQNSPRLLEPLVMKGLLIQVNASSLLGRHGEQAEKTSLLMLRHRWVQFIASDAHSTEHRRPLLKKAVKRLTEITDETTAFMLSKENGCLILSGREIPTNPIEYQDEAKSWMLPGISFLRRFRKDQKKMEQKHYAHN